MSLRKILSYTLGIGLIIFVVRQVMMLFSGSGFLSVDIERDLNPSPPAKKGWEAV